MVKRIMTKPSYKVLAVALLIAFGMNMDFKWQQQERSQSCVDGINCIFCHAPKFKTVKEYKQYHKKTAKEEWGQYGY